ncbi:MAG: hypothetical protein V1834_02750 [Candidatus Micrarchaeota archaeon]
MGESKRFPFVLYGSKAMPRPLVYCRFPSGSVFPCLVDSGASSSFIDEKMLVVQEKKRARPNSPFYEAVGICGRECFEIHGETEAIEIKVEGLSEKVKLVFQIVGQRHNLEQPVLGLNFFDFFKVSFVKEKEQYYTVLEC